jgi:hypothetical protein
MMYVPHFEAILKNLGLSREEFNESAMVQVPTPMLQFLLQLVVANGEFNKAGYLAANEDIAEAERSGSMPNPRLHYIKFGFFEGRRGATPPVNEVWYKKTYPDIDDAIRAGALASASEHFLVQGAAEGRAPSEKFYLDAAEWKQAFGLA